MPKRVQLRRSKGWRKPEGVVVVSRPGRWGNPFRVGDFGIRSAADAVQRYREWLDGRVVGPKPPTDFSVLAGHDLACWCSLDQPCHADVLLKLAND
ncbi:MAG: DUF4326 domain-containing protein [Xanthomonadales bacterium]|nr:DUF4326 domain-containing protein [Xanthomonadales bacterium]